MRGLPADRQPVGPPAHVHDLWAHRMLRFVAESPRPGSRRGRADDRMVLGRGETWSYCFIDDVMFVAQGSGGV